jgi:hypothetical protein
MNACWADCLVFLVYLIGMILHSRAVETTPGEMGVCVSCHATLLVSKQASWRVCERYSCRAIMMICPAPSYNQ